MEAILKCDFSRGHVDTEVRNREKKQPFNFLRPKKRCQQQERWNKRRIALSDHAEIAGFPNQRGTPHSSTKVCMLRCKKEPAENRTSGGSRAEMEERFFLVAGDCVFALLLMHGTRVLWYKNFNFDLSNESSRSGHEERMYGLRIGVGFRIPLDSE